MAATEEAIGAFFAQNRIAVVGVSRKKAHFSRMVFKALRERDYDVVPVNPSAGEIDSVRAFRTPGEVDPPPGAVLVMTKRPAPELLRACLETRPAALWVYRAGGSLELPPGAATRLITDECPLMYLKNAGWIHSLHRRLRSWFGSMPPPTPAE